MDDDLKIMMKKKNELLRRIEENKRLMELIRNPHIKDSLGPLLMMKRNIAVKKIQNYWRSKITKKNSKNIYSTSYKNNPKEKVNYIFKIVKIQKAVRDYLSYKRKEKLTSHYINESNRELFQNLKFDRVNQIKNEIITNIKSKEIPNKNTDFQEILNEYYTGYKNFNEEFPEHIKLRNNNLSRYHQCINLVNHMSTQNNLENLSKFDEFYINNNKKEIVRNNFNSIINSIDQNMWWYKYRDIDDFEQDNIINEVDSHFNFERISDIINK